MLIVGNVILNWFPNEKSKLQQGLCTFLHIRDQLAIDEEHNFIVADARIVIPVRTNSRGPGVCERVLVSGHRRPIQRMATRSRIFGQQHICHELSMLCAPSSSTLRTRHVLVR